MTRLKWLLVGLFVGGLYPAVTWSQGGISPIMMLQGKVDSNYALVISMVSGGSVGAATSAIANLPGKVTSANALVVSCPDLSCAGGGAADPTFTPVAFAALGTPANGVLNYCSDCTIANPCAGSGTGAFAKRLNGIWVCN